jgi:hypothetical protein
VLLTAAFRREVSDCSPAALLSAVAPVVSPGYSLAEQLEYAAQFLRPGQYDHVAAALSSAPGQFHRRMRSVVYSMLGLGEPARPPFVAPPPPPPSLTRWEISVGSGASL